MKISSVPVTPPTRKRDEQDGGWAMSQFLEFETCMKSEADLIEALI